MKIKNLTKDEESGAVHFEMEMSRDEHEFLLFTAMSMLFRLGIIKDSEISQAIDKEEDVEVDLSKLDNEAFYNAN